MVLSLSPKTFAQFYSSQIEFYWQLKNSVEKAEQIGKLQKKDHAAIIIEDMGDYEVITLGAVASASEVKEYYEGEGQWVFLPISYWKRFVEILWEKKMGKETKDF